MSKFSINVPDNECVGIEDMYFSKPKEPFFENVGSWIIEGDLRKSEEITVKCPYCKNSAVIDRTKGSHTVFLTKFCPNCGKQLCEKDKLGCENKYTKRQIVNQFSDILSRQSVIKVDRLPFGIKVSKEDTERIRKEIQDIVNGFLGTLCTPELPEKLEAFLSGYVRGVYDRLLTGKEGIWSPNNANFYRTKVSVDGSKINISFPYWFASIFGGGEQ